MFPWAPPHPPPHPPPPQRPPPPKNPPPPHLTSLVPGRAAIFARLRIFSGIQPTGRKHLGNYIGGITQYVAGQERGDPAIYCIVDLHSTTVDYDPDTLRDAATTSRRC